MIVLTLAFGVVVLLFARDVFSPVGGLVALAVVLFAFARDGFTKMPIAQQADLKGTGFSALHVMSLRHLGQPRKGVQEYTLTTPSHFIRTATERRAREESYKHVITPRSQSKIT